MLRTSLAQIKPALAMLLLMTVLTGLAYPAAVTVAAKALFPFQAQGSLIVRDGHVVGSELIGQPFSGERYFWSRPSATTPNPYNAAASGGSNLGPSSEDLLGSVRQRADAFKAANKTASVPVDMATASASGLDPHISPASAMLQAGRVAAARGLDEKAVRDLVAAHTEGRQLGIFGEPRVNVLKLNLALDSLAQSK